MTNTTAPLLKKINEYGQLMLSAGLDAGSDFADRHRDGTRKESEAGELLASITADITNQQASTPQAAMPAEWRDHPASIDTDWFVSADGKVLAEVGSINLGGGSPYYAIVGTKRLDHRYVDRANAKRDVEAAIAQATHPATPQIEVWFGSMPESNGRENWTVTLRRKERPSDASPHAIHRLMSGVSVYRSEFKDRARYEADRLRFLLGEIDKAPDILDYDAGLHSGYAEPAAAGGQRWMPIDQAQENVEMVVFWREEGAGPDSVRYDFDILEDGVWQKHSERHEHYLMIGGPRMGPGPSEMPPYTHCMALAPLTAPESEPAPKPAVPPLPFLVGEHAKQAAVNKPIVQHIMDLARRFRAAPGGDYDVAYKSLEAFVYGVLAARPLQSSTQPEQSDADEVGVWCRYVAGMVVAYLGGPVDDVRIKPIAGIIQRRLHHLAAYGLPSTDKLVHELASCRDAMPRFPETDNEFVESIGDALSVAAYVRATITHIQTGKSWA